MDTTGRRYRCARCGKEALICSACDHGNRCCADGCAKLAQSHSKKQAAQRYQSSPKGRIKHATRQRGYMAKKNKMTHQGWFAPTGADAVVILSCIALLPCLAIVRTFTR